MPRPAIARHEEGTYRPYSTNEERCQTGWIGGQQCEVILDQALRGSDVYEGDGLIMSTIQDQGAGGARGGRRRRGQRRVASSLSEINVVPMVAVMLVLLIIFMVAAPMMQTLQLSPEATMLAGASGSIIVKYVNSSYFWVCTSLSRMSVNAALISFGGVTFVNGVVSMALVYALWAFGVI